MSLKTHLSLFCLVVLLYSCQKAASVEAKMTGKWERVVFNHNGSEQWIFTSDSKIYIMLTLPGAQTQSGANIDGDTVCVGSFAIKITHRTDGTFLNKNMFKVPAITISGFTNYKYSGSNLDFTAYNTEWQVFKLNTKVMILTTEMYNGIHGGLEEREFYKK